MAVEPGYGSDPNFPTAQAAQKWLNERYRCPAQYPSSPPLTPWQALDWNLRWSGGLGQVYSPLVGGSDKLFLLRMLHQSVETVLSRPTTERFLQSAALGERVEQRKGRVGKLGLKRTDLWAKYLGSLLEQVQLGKKAFGCLPVSEFSRAGCPIFPVEDSFLTAVSANGRAVNHPDWGQENLTRTIARLNILRLLGFELDSQFLPQHPPNIQIRSDGHPGYSYQEGLYRSPNNPWVHYRVITHTSQEGDDRGMLIAISEQMMVAGEESIQRLL